MTRALPDKQFSRRSFVKGGGALIVGFGLTGAGFAGKAAASSTADATLGGPWATVPLTSLDSWLRIGQDGKVTAFSSRVDAGQGLDTGFMQIIADELDVPFSSIKLITGDSALTPEHGGIGSASGMINQSQPLRWAAAEARLALLKLASARFGVPVAQLSVSDGVITAGSQRVTYGELIGGQLFKVNLRQVSLPGVPVRSGATAYVTGEAQLKQTSQYKVIGKSIPRVDIPGKVTGAWTYAHNVRIPGMVHARLVLPPSPSSKLVRINGFKGGKPDGLIRVFSKGNFVAVVTEREYEAIQGMKTLDVTWTEPEATLPTDKNLHTALRLAPKAIPDVTNYRAPRAQGQSSNPNRGNVQAALASAAKTLKADYYFPPHSHGSIGPQCSVATVSGGQAIVFAPAGSINQCRNQVAGVLGIPSANVRIIATEGSGQYGRVSLSEDTAPAAALISQAVGRPVRLQFMREHDFQTDPYGVPMSFRFQSGLDAQGTIVAWGTELWTWAVNPQTEGPTLTAMLTGAARPGPFGSQNLQAFGGGDINTYEFANQSFVAHQVAPSLRVGNGNLRSPKRIQWNFASESFIDELASVAGADPIAFRLQQLRNTEKVVAANLPGFDPSHYQRQIATVEALRTAMEWEARPSPGPGSRSSEEVVTGRGMSTMGNYTNVFGSMGAEVEVNKKTGRVRVTKLVNVVDPGLIINPKAARNTVEQGVIFALSRALHEDLKFDRKVVHSKDWVTYPILRFLDVPDQELVMINRPEYWAGGLGEGNEIQVPGAVGNAIFDAAGIRLREVPFTPERVRAALKAAGTK
jgi:CO/xanthine dehydrogenase Mo-binding subunit